MLTTAILAGRAMQKKSSSKKAQTEEEIVGGVMVLYVILVVLIIIVMVLKYIGTCTIFARANPRFPVGGLVVVFLLFLFFGDFYLIYFSVRWGVNGLRSLAGKRVVDYRTLPYPRSEGRSAKNE